MKDILEDIVARKKERILQKKALGLYEAEKARYASDKAEGKLLPIVSMANKLKQTHGGIIAEFKRRSPSKGWICADGKADEIPLSYAQNGAAALSVLTEEDFFGGSMEDLQKARQSLDAKGLTTPLLRKDFILDTDELYEARNAGAAAVLLIAACLTREDCAKLTEQAHELGLEVLLEVHHEDELIYTQLPVDMVGVNNRNLGTFFTTVDNSYRLLPLLPSDKVLVSESGIDQPQTVVALQQAGFQAFLIGESFMRNASPGTALAHFLEKI